MLSNSTKQLLNTGGGHQAPRKAAPCLQKDAGQNIKDKKRDKRVRDRDPSLGGSCKRGEVSKHQETLSLGGSVGSFGISEGNVTGRKKEIKPTDFAPNHNSQRRSSPDARICHQQAGAGQRGVGGIISS